MNYIEVKVQIPEERLSEFHQMLGRWLGSSPSIPRPERPAPRLPDVSAGSKYAALKPFFENQEGNRLTLSFSDIEAVMGEDLPDSARNHRPWWANTLHPTRTHSRIWMSAGWMVTDIDMQGERVTFKRT